MKTRIETLCAHSREALPSENPPLVAPIFQSSVWTLESIEQCEAVYDGSTPGFIYTRDANPNHRSLERILASLEEAEEAVVFASGMAALAGAVCSVASQGCRVVAARQLYGVTARLLDSELRRFGVDVEWVDITDLAAVEQAAAAGAAAILAETVANPLIEVADIPALSEISRRVGARLLVDSTFASPFCCQPLLLGADLVIHSLTKFLGGHGDLTLGAVCGPQTLMEQVRNQAKVWGGAANPFDSWLALRGIATFPLRMERSVSNAGVLAERLEQHPSIRRVNYPGLASHPQHIRAREVMAHSGAMLSFELASGDAARHVIRSLSRIRFAPSLGDVATTVSYPLITSHRAFTAEQLAAAGITAGLIRLSVGIDHVDDVWADLQRALDSLGSTS